MPNRIKVLITGSNGFLGSNLIKSINSNDDIDVVKIPRDMYSDISSYLDSDVNIIFHLAGVNRPKCVNEFDKYNSELTNILCLELEKFVKNNNKKISVVYSSSIQAELDNPYGKSKLKAESYLIDFCKRFELPLYVYRLSNLFGKWSRPNYNSVVATFCYNIANNLPIEVQDPKKEIQLTYIDDVITEFLSIINSDNRSYSKNPIYYIDKIHITSLGKLAQYINKFHNERKDLFIENVGDGFLRKLYSTYLSYIPPNDFSYLIPKYSDKRGDFVEMLKTPASGQFSYFTAKKGVTRGNHYHHTKNEKFLVIKGIAEFNFINIKTFQEFSLVTTGDKPEIVDSIPGWSHSIKNIGDVDLIVALWANEVFDTERPDTYYYK